MANVVLAPIHTRLLMSRTLIGRSAIAVSHTGNTSIQQLASISIPGGTIGPNGTLFIDAGYGFTGTAGAKTLSAQLGGTTIFSNVAGASALHSRMIFTLFNRNAQNSQIVVTGITTVAMPTATIDTSAATTLTFHVQLGNAADTARLEAYAVELLYGA